MSHTLRSASLFDFLLSLVMCVNICYCRSVLPFTMTYEKEWIKTDYNIDSSNYAGRPGSLSLSLDSVWLLKQEINTTYRSLSQKVSTLTAISPWSRSQLSRVERSFSEVRSTHFGLAAAKYHSGFLLYNQYIRFMDINEKVRHRRAYLELTLRPWPQSGGAVKVPYFFSAVNDVPPNQKKWMLQAIEDVTKNTCVTLTSATVATGATCDTALPGVAHSICIETGDRCLSPLGAAGNPQRLVVNDTCLTPAMALRLVTLAVGLGYQSVPTNYMLADAGGRGLHGYCDTKRANVSKTFDIKSVSTVGFRIDTGSSQYAAVHVTPRAEDQVVLHNRPNNYFELRNVDIAQINAFNRCEEPAYGGKCGQSVKYCHDRLRSAKYPNIIGVRENCDCLCTDGWTGRRCDRRHRERTDRAIYGCHKHIVLRKSDVGGTSGIFLLSDIKLDLTATPPFICTVSIRSKLHALGYYCPGYSPIISIDASHLYRALIGVEPFTMHEACARFRMYFQSGVDGYQRRLLCVDSILESEGRLQLRPTGPNTTLYFVMNPENRSEAAALSKVQILIHNRLNVMCDSVLYYRNPLAFNVHKSEFIFHTKYLVQILIGIVVFLICSYILYDYWSTRKRIQALHRRKVAKEEVAIARSSSEESGKSTKSSTSSKNSNIVQTLLGGKGEKKEKQAKPASNQTKKEESSSSDSLEFTLNPFGHKEAVQEPPPKADSQAKTKAAKETEKPPKKETAKARKEKPHKDSSLPPINVFAGKIRQVSDLDKHTAAGVVEEPTPMVSRDSAKSSPSPSPSPPPPPKKTAKEKARKIRKQRRKRVSSSSSSSNETLKEALVKYISSVMNSTDDSEDDESSPA